jgi:ATP synthase protein I
MSGLIGWTVVVPTLIGAAIGLRIDDRHPSSYSWTLMLLLSGLIVGCLNAWRWLDREHTQIQDDQND